tara:strand:- start:2260 stop:3222 length:963 start_codon:yes stop_codon:yes gene_type:complete
MADSKPVKPVNPVNKYICLCCDYKCNRKYDYDQHLATQKHKKTDNLTNPAIMAKLVNEFVCMCGKKYKHKQSLFKHQKKCDYEEHVCVEIKKPTTDISGDIVAILMGQLEKQRDESKEQMEKQRDEIKEQSDKKDKQMMEQIELLTNTIKDMIPKMGNNNNITNNNQFNINMFLNEECKDAINMSDFLKSIEVSLAQLQYTTNNGLEKGVTRVIMDNMNKLSKYERPLHCSDVKRETIYIKENDIWEKDTNKEKLKNVIKNASGKNYTALTNWNKENPNFMRCDDKQMFYAKTISAIGKPIDGVEDKIIKQICKDTYVKE